MTWFTNIDKVPAGKSLYTAYLAQRQDDGTFEVGDEIDFVAMRGLYGQGALTAAYDSDAFKDTYLALARGGRDVVIAVADQGDGDVVADYRGSYGI